MNRVTASADAQVGLRSGVVAVGPVKCARGQRTQACVMLLMWGMHGMRRAGEEAPWVSGAGRSTLPCNSMYGHSNLLLK
jgi:hypothetical protein